MIVVVVSVGVLSIVLGIAHLMRLSREFFAEVVPLSERKLEPPRPCDCWWCVVRTEIEHPYLSEPAPLLVRPYVAA